MGRLIACIALIPLILGYGGEALGFAFKAIAVPGPLVPFLVGMCAYGLLWAVFLRRTAGFWAVWEHEFTHALFCAVLFRRIAGFAATEQGGVVTHEASRDVRDIFITLAPYFFPTFTVLLLTVRFAIAAPYLPGFDFLLGLTFAYHVISTAKETHLGQPDLRRFGLIFSMVVIVALNVFFLLLVFSTVYGGPGGAWEALAGGWYRSVSMVMRCVGMAPGT